MQSRTNPGVLILSICTLGLLCMSGCDNGPRNNSMELDDTDRPVTSEEVQKEAGEAAETTKEYLSQKKDEFMASMQDKLADMDVSMEKIKAEGAELKGEAKENWEAAMEEFEVERAEFNAKMKTWRENRGEAWEEAKTGLEKAWQELNTAKEDALDELKETHVKEPEPESDSPQ